MSRSRRDIALPFRRKSLLIVIATSLLALIAGVVAVYRAHAAGFCISEWRSVPDQELYLKGMANEAAYLSSDMDVKNLRRYMVNVGKPGAVSEAGIRPSEAAVAEYAKSAATALEPRLALIRQMLEDPVFVKRCCARVERDAENGGRPGFFEILLGKSHLTVRIRADLVVAEPEAFVPPLRVDPKTSEWQQTGQNLSVLPDRVLLFKPSYFYPDFDVCGRRVEGF